MHPYERSISVFVCGGGEKKDEATKDEEATEDLYEDENDAGSKGGDGDGDGDEL